MSFGKGKIKRIIAVEMLVMMGSVAGCGASLAEQKVDISDITSPSQPSLVNYDYTAPIQTPKIYVDQTGFNIDSEKVAVFCAKELPESFRIVDIDSGETAYTGEVVKPIFDENTGYYYGIGHFNDLEIPGNYYISADNVGESYSFEIGENVYREAFDKACINYYINRCGIAISQAVAGENGHSACHTAEAHLQDSPEVGIDVTGGWHMDEQADRNVLLGCKIVENLLLAYEMNEDVFSDEVGITESGNGVADILDEVKYEVEWLLKMQDARTGGVYASALTQVDENSDVFLAPVEVTAVSMDTTINFAASMAQFSYFYQQHNPEFATTVLRAADRAWECYFNNQKAMDNSAAFKAAASLYRATGNEKYNEVLTKYFDDKDFLKNFNEDENILLGSVTYLSTNQEVDKQQCDVLIKALMKKSEKIAEESVKSDFLVAHIPEESNYSDFFADMRCLTITDYVIYNHEYTTIIENHLHYLQGMNIEAINLITDDTEHSFHDSSEKQSIINNPQYDSMLILMMSVLEL